MRFMDCEPLCHLNIDTILLTVILGNALIHQLVALIFHTLVQKPFLIRTIETYSSMVAYFAQHIR